jgi:hypothetical protein
MGAEKEQVNTRAYRNLAGWRVYGPERLFASFLPKKEE